ncbi:MAG: hypothetical protein GXC72_07725 [Chitinophagaceae bacterium]|nr:hypothetical protein [Chitinophagaceae bacterium]
MKDTSIYQSNVIIDSPEHQALHKAEQEAYIPKELEFLIIKSSAIKKSEDSPSTQIPNVEIPESNR